jgi:hypothetical protein
MLGCVFSLGARPILSFYSMAVADNIVHQTSHDSLWLLFRYQCNIRDLHVALFRKLIQSPTQTPSP